MTASKPTITALNMPAMVPLTTAVRRCSVLQRSGSVDAILEGSAVARAWVVDDGDVVLVIVDEVTDVVVEDVSVVDVLNWNAPRNFVLIFGAVASLQQLLRSLAARQQ